MSATTAPSLTQAITIKLREPARARNLELVLLVIACGICAGAMVLVQLGTKGRVFDTSVLWTAASILGLALVMHVILRIVAKNADPFILPVALVLNGIGIAEIYRIDIHNGVEGWAAIGVKQIAWTLLAMVFAIATILLVRNHRFLQRYRYIFMLLTIVLLLLPMLPGIGTNIGGARVWIRIGPFSFQPGELAKITMALFFAGYLVTARDSLSIVGRKFLGMTFPRARDLGPILIIWGVAMSVLVFQRDLGTALLYFGLFLVMIYVATARLSWVVIGLVLFVGGALVAASVLVYVQGRFEQWLDPFDQQIFLRQTQGSYQLVQGLFGFANGGITGTGLGQGRPYITPVANADYIIASIGEELGLIGVFAVLGLFVVLVSRGIRVGFMAQDDFGKLLGIGFGFTIALQVFVVVGGITRIIPVTGLTTPFMAAGGSSLVANWIIAAMLLRLTDSIPAEQRIQQGALSERGNTGRGRSRKERR
ncbi:MULTISPECIES: FtsW/RodA/SpoVE family cell cycle protein [unclassified Curtobacterium]|uniref:FtsW/RodA/SpoVE family cell cycle protein n=1 Tax=unclassified Curtobacterium TaxID=257496 RepID=UPI000D84861F|nr:MULTISPECIES: FtsW/RodA/SpoVE family cell cycle protein [unclassified Curtobacterium]PYY36500.1 cell division protein FtsW [Curtobacterium sp. MCBD17_030]PZE37077.1 cell division protein FtsW [Curtobacterium sp. MCPF17_031]PZF15571.1 cell division protein FtsW [Curtobacterium sp. MCPF17_011]